MVETEASAPVRWDSARSVIILRDDRGEGRVQISAIDPEGPHVSLFDAGGQVRASMRLLGPLGLPTIQFVRVDGKADGTVVLPAEFLERCSELFGWRDAFYRTWRRTAVRLYAIAFAALAVSVLALLGTF